MVKIYLSINNNEEVILLPVTPEKYGLKESWNNQEVVGIYQALNIRKNKGLSTIAISSFFPTKDYPFLLNRTMWGMDYVEKIRKWQKRMVPIRIVITSDNKSMNTLSINMAVTIDDLETETGKDGDIYYTLNLKEFVFVEVK